MQEFGPPKSVRRNSLLTKVTCGSLLLSSVPVASAIDLFWDPAQNQSNSGGAGVWNGTNLFWNDDNAAPNVVLNNNADVAVFGGTGGIVSGLNVQANGVRFTANNYTIQGSNSDLTLNAGGISVTAGVSGTTFNNIRRILLNTATFTNTDLVTFSNSPTVINGSGKTLTVNNSIAGATTTLGNFSVTQSASNGNVYNIINGSGNVTIAGNLGAAGNFGTPIASNTTTTNTLAYGGSATLRLDGNNIDFRATGAGGVMNFRLTSGTLALGHNNALGAFSDAANTVATTSTFELNGGTVIGTATRNIANTTHLTASSTIGGSNTFTLGGNFTNSGGDRTLTVNNSAATTLSGNVFLAETNVTRTLTVGGTGSTTISGVVANNSIGNTAASNLTKSGAGTVILSGNNSYSGLTSISGGTLKLGHVSALGTSAITLASGGTLDLNGNAITNGFGTNVSRGTLANTGAAVDISATTINNSGSFAVDGTGNITLGTLTGGSGNALVKSGNNTVTLAGTADNSFLAATVNAGTLVLKKAGNGTAIGASGGGATGLTINSGGQVQLGTTGNDNQIWDLAKVVVNSGGVFDLNGKSETTDGWSVSGTGINSGGALVNSAAATNGTLTGTVTLLANTSMGGVGNVNVASSVAGSSYVLTKVGAGSLTLSGANTLGGTTVNAGTLKMGNANALGATTNALAVNGGSLDLNGNSLTVGALSGSGGAINSSATGNLTLTAGNATNTSFAGLIHNGSATALNFSKNGVGALTLSSSDSSYTGVTTVGAGVLSVSTLANGGSSSSIGSSSSSAANLVISGDSTLQYTGGSVSTDRNFTVGSNGGRINVSGATTELTFAGATLGGNTFTKTGAGSLALGNIGATAGATIGVTDGVATLQGSGDNPFLAASVTSGTLVLAKSSAFTVHALGGNSMVSSGGTIKLAGSGNDQIWDNSSLAINSGGTLDMGGVSEKVKSISGSGAVINSSSTLSTLTVSGYSGSSIFDGVISGNIALAHSDGNSSTTLNGLNTYRGNTTIGNSSAIFNLGSTGGLTFYIGDGGVNNRINGATGATVNLDGIFTFDLTNAAIASGNIWNIVDVGNLAVNYGSNFSLNGFTQAANAWSKVEGDNTWTFTESTGALSLAVIPEPASALLGGLGVLTLLRRRRI